MSLDYQLFSFDKNIIGDNRDSFSDYYVPNVETKDFNVLIDGKRFFGLLLKNEEEGYEKIIEVSNNNDYTTDNYWILVILKKITN